MGSDVCVNISCGSAASHEWKMGWPLRSGGFAQFCNNCGISKECKPDDTLDFISTFENSVFCDKFHREETGWRDCSFCNKPIHCGCIVSKSLFDFLDFGGIGCVSCIRASQYCLMQNARKPNSAVTSTINDANDRHSAHINGRPFVDSVDEGKLIQLCRVVEASETSRWHQPQRDEIISSSGPNSQEVKCPIREVDSRFSNLMTPSIQPSTLPMLENNRTWEIKNMHELPAQPSLSMSLGIPSGNSVLPSAREIVEERLEGKQSPSFHQGQRSCLILPKPSKTGMTMNVETNKGMNSQARFARPPAEGRGKNQLLPRYWPRITDQELEQLSGNLKSNVVPLFEKVLSASDAGRIGRLVLPKACAEAYFPPISQSEGLPLRMQDVKGNEWTFQFRFWPNNNSRMYVLEGVTPCIQAMQLCAGDTVTFSRIDPGGKLVMGFRKASNSVETQDVSTSAHSNGVSMKETTFSGATENLPAGSSYSDLLHSMEGNREPQSNGVSEYLHLDRRVSDLPKTENCGEMTNNNSLQQSISGSEKKRTRNIGPKSKRLLIHCEDALELRLTWEEAQDLLRPPPTVQPSIVTIEDHVFEEYNEPPVFGKRTIFSTCPSGGQEQWAPCDDCSKWRRLPVDVLLPPNWTCCENVWDASRSSCSAPEELSPKELENLLKPSKGHLQDSKKRRVIENNESPQELEPSGLDALASAAVLGDNLVDPCDSSAGGATTTKHPRHRPGCTCIVCIQPPSGKGKHDPACTCNVCMTVKRRFKTLMLRKKQRRSEREADATQMDQRDLSDMNGAPTEDTSHLEKAESMNKRQPEVGESSAGQIDLNCHPEREDMEVDVPGPSMNGHLIAPNYPVQEYMNQNGPTGESQRYFSNGGSFGSIVWERERRDNEVYNEQKKNDTNSNQKTQNNPSK